MKYYTNFIRLFKELGIVSKVIMLVLLVCLAVSFGFTCVMILKLISIKWWKKGEKEVKMVYVIYIFFYVIYVFFKMGWSAFLNGMKKKIVNIYRVMFEVKGFSDGVIFLRAMVFIVLLVVFIVLLAYAVGDIILMLKIKNHKF